MTSPSPRDCVDAPDVAATDRRRILALEPAGNEVDRTFLRERRASLV